MIVTVSKNNQINDIKEYIGEKYKTVPYLYANLNKYGLGTRHVSTWIDYGNHGQIEGVYLLYYDCLHFFTNTIEEYPINKLMNFIGTQNHKVIMLQKSIGQQVEQKLKEDYIIEINQILDMDNVGLKNEVFRCEIGKRDDIVQIAELLIEDPVFRNVYDKQILINQMMDRYDQGFSRYFVAKIDNKVVASYSTYAEIPGFAIVNGIIVHPKYRRRGLAADVINFACHVLEKENISRVTFVNHLNHASLALHEKLGAVCIGAYAKFIKNIS